LIREFTERRRARAFEEAMAKMADDPAIWKECGAISREFAAADADGLSDDWPRRDLRGGHGGG